MKRSREELSPSEQPAKTERRYKETTPKSTPKSSPMLLHKPRKLEAEEKEPSTSSFSSSSSPPLEREAEESPPIGVDSLGELFGWWSCGVDEEMLLGWFPFVDEDFLCHESRGGGGGLGAFWEEGMVDLHDIWQLQNIHEVPNSTK